MSGALNESSVEVSFVRGSPILKLRYLGGIVMDVGAPATTQSFIHEQFIIRLRLVVLIVYLFRLWRHESTLRCVHLISLAKNARAIRSLTLGIDFIDKTETRANRFGSADSWCILSS